MLRPAAKHQCIQFLLLKQAACQSGERPTNMPNILLAYLLLAIAEPQNSSVLPCQKGSPFPPAGNVGTRHIDSLHNTSFLTFSIIRGEEGVIKFISLCTYPRQRTKATNTLTNLVQGWNLHHITPLLPVFLQDSQATKNVWQLFSTDICVAFQLKSSCNFLWHTLLPCFFTFISFWLL